MSNVTLTKKEEFLSLKMIHFYRRHPVWACEDLLGLPVSSPHFRITLKAAWHCDHHISVLSRGMMKSTINAIISILKALLWPNRTQLVLGPLFRHGKMVMEAAGVEPIIQSRMGRMVHRKGFCEASVLKQRGNIMSRGTDLWRVKFLNGSLIMTGPLGQRGDSLLGTRANDLYLDEMRDFNKLTITKTILPFLNVLADPFGNASEEEGFEGNTFKYSGTIRYTDDYYYQIISENKEKMERDKELLKRGFCPLLKRSTYSVVEWNYEDAFILEKGVKRPKVFTVDVVNKLIEDKKMKFYFRINVEEIEAARDSDVVNIEDWAAENKNVPIKLGSKEFPYLLLRSISDDIEITSKKITGAEYMFPEALQESEFISSKDFISGLEPLTSCEDPTVMGVDVATESDKFSIVIIRPGTLLGNTFDHIVYAFAKAHMSYSDMLAKIYECVDSFSVVSIHMDKRGGGTALRDMLREPTDKTKFAVVDEGTDEKAKIPSNRRNMLHMVNATAETNTTTVNAIKAKFQSKKLLMPRILSTHPIREKETIYKDLSSLRSQFGKIRAKAVGAGWRKYYIPEAKSSDASLEKGYKDLFSATLYATDALIEYVEKETKTKKLDNLKVPMPRWVPMG